MSKTISVDVDVDLDDFDEDDIIEYLEDCGYEVRSTKKKAVSQPSYPSTSLEGMESSIETVKDVLQRRSYDPQFIRLMLTEIADMPLGSSIDKVCEQLKTMCM